MNFKTENKVNLVKTKRFWIMLPFFLVMSGWIVAGYVYPMILGQIAVTKINHFINNGYKDDSFGIETLLDAIKDSGDKKLIAAVIDSTGTTWRFDWIRFTSLAVTSGDSTTYVMHAYYPPAEYLMFYSSYFTTLSNIFIAVLFGISTFKPQWEGKKGILSSKIMIVGSTYITVTCLIFNFAMFPLGVVKAIAAGRDFFHVYTTKYDGFSNSFLHIFNPIVFVVYQCVFAKHHIDVDNIKKENKKLILTEIYILLGYGAYAIIRGLIKTASGSPVDDNKAWPYFFTQILNNKSVLGSFPASGFILFLIFVGIIAGIVVGFGTMYITIIKKRQLKGKYDSLEFEETSTNVSA